MYDLIRAGAAVPKLKVADCKYNTEQISSLINQADDAGIKILCFPELSVSSYTCGDLFLQTALIRECENSINLIAAKSKHTDMLIAAGAPVVCDNQTFNCAVLINKGKILGIVPKTYVPNYSEFYEKRWFSPAGSLISDQINYCGQDVPIGSDLIFK